MRIRDRRNGSEPKEKMINPKAETLLKPAPKITRVRGNQAGISGCWHPFLLIVSFLDLESQKLLSYFPVFHLYLESSSKSYAVMSLNDGMRVKLYRENILCCIQFQPGSQKVLVPL